MPKCAPAGDNPETAYEERNACKWLSNWPRGQGGDVETGVGGIETAFLAKPSGFSGKRPCHPERNGEKALLLAAKILAMTVYDYPTQAELRRTAAEEFEKAAR